jgi:hypothetical protein
MATVSKVLARTTAATTSTTLYTTPAGTTTIVTNIVIANPTTAAVTATVTLDAVDLVPAVSIAANSLFAFDLKQVLPAADVIAGFASSTSVTFHISGVEVA